MKKRVLSMILMVCMIVSLLVGFTVSAAAEAGIVTYTLKDGDTVLKACQKNGIDFYAKQKLIAAINNIVDYRSLPVGFTVKLPTDAYVASASTAAAVSAGSSAVAVPGAASAANIAVGDTVSYYLIKYQMRSGDTVADVCNSLGVNFGTYSSMIKDINGIGNWNNVKAGSTILIPSATTPPVGTSCYAVVAHTVASGETASSICSSYGLSYGANESLLKAINNKSNLNSIMRGSSFMVPVSTTIKGSGTVPAGSGSSSSGSSSSSSSSSSVNSNSTTYTIKAAPSANGSFEMRVAGKAATKAAAGEKVQVYCVPTGKYQVGYISVKTADGKAVALSGDTFTMPAGNVTVSVDFVTKTAYEIISVPCEHGCVNAFVGGASASKAYGDATVTVVATPDEGYELDYAQYSTDYRFFDWSNDPNVVSGKTTAKTFFIPADGTFKMPEAKVYLRGVFKEATYHSITKVSSLDVHGSVKDFKVAGNSVNSTRAGLTVTVDTAPSSSGFAFKALRVYKNNGANKPDYNYPVATSGNTFVMPGFDVVVFVEYSGTPIKLTAKNTEHGKVSFKNKYYETVTSVDAEEQVIVEIVPSTGYEIDTFKWNGTDKKSSLAFIDSSSSPTYNSKAYYTFTASGTDTANDVTVEVTFKQQPSVTIKLDNSIGYTSLGNPVGSTKDHAVGTISLNVNGFATAFDSNKYGNGQTILATDGVTVTVTTKGDYKLENLYYTVGTNTTPILVTSGVPFSMADATSSQGENGDKYITIHPIWVGHRYSLTSESPANGSIDYITYTVYDVSGTKFVNGVDASAGLKTGAIPAGTKITVHVTPAADYRLTSVYFKNSDGYVTDITSTYDPATSTVSFDMPKSDVTIGATFATLGYTVCPAGQLFSDPSQVVIAGYTLDGKAVASANIQAVVGQRFSISLEPKPGFVITSVDGVRQDGNGFYFTQDSSNSNVYYFDMVSGGLKSITVHTAPAP